MTSPRRSARLRTALAACLLVLAWPAAATATALPSSSLAAPVGPARGLEAPSTTAPPCASSPLLARHDAAPQQLGEVSWRRLPQQARDTYLLILQGGPFPYDRDGTVFFNRERLLPPKARGHYREYTVPTPRVRHRGARRIVCGGQQPTQPERCYYTADHYNSFRLIRLPDSR